VKRREFITLIGGAASAWPFAASAQQPAKASRIGYLGFAPASAYATRVEALRTGLRDLGWVEGCARGPREGAPGALLTRCSRANICA
jgi:putative ABC transport system substrate-binding protein